jgi:hypothetical protein
MLSHSERKSQGMVRVYADRNENGYGSVAVLGEGEPMNDDQISRAAAIDILDAYQVMIENGEENPYAWARLRMSELPPAQPEIIHCRDCKHRGEKPISDGRYWCDIHDTFMYYCSDAERRTDEGD